MPLKTNQTPTYVIRGFEALYVLTLDYYKEKIVMKIKNNQTLTIKLEGKEVEDFKNLVNTLSDDLDTAGFTGLRNSFSDAQKDILKTLTNKL